MHGEVVRPQNFASAYSDYASAMQSMKHVTTHTLTYFQEEKFGVRITGFTAGASEERGLA